MTTECFNVKKLYFFSKVSKTQTINILTLYWEYQDVHCIPSQRQTVQFLVEELPAFFDNHISNRKSSEQMVSNSNKCLLNTVQLVTHTHTSKLRLYFLGLRFFWVQSFIHIPNNVISTEELLSFLEKTKRKFTTKLTD